VRNLPSGAANFRLSALVEGAWLPLAEGACDGSETWSIPTAVLATCDPETKLLAVNNRSGWNGSASSRAGRAAWLYRLTRPTSTGSSATCTPD
jgi:hypothetical protein